ncbi:MAG: S41 family peptidase, partial [Candidatus Kerfeldbacteria bacterium]|nr:S41 family peptidase [Candidatus Kerfeldbacteria bacterium]
TTASEFSSAVQSILLKQPAGLIIDLRNNPGGYLDAAVDVADAFLVDGAILIEDYGNSRTNTVSADDAAPLAGMRTVVLVDEGSASAAEILAGALRDRLQAPLIGEKTFGKGSVQEIEDLPDGSTLKLTVAHRLTPNGTSIDKTGLQPDLVIAGSETPAETDPQLDAALERLSK